MALKCMKTLSATVIAATIGFSASAAQASVILNGNFDAGLSPWQTSGNVTLAGQYGAGFNWGAGSVTQDGIYAISFNGGDKTPNGKVWQTFATQVGMTYNVTFDYGVTSSNGRSQSINVSALDSSNKSLAAITATATSYNWTATPLSTFHFSFVADSIQSTLMFADISYNNSISLDGLLDNVSVVAASVPEPASLALLGAGFVGLGALRRRNKA